VFTINLQNEISKLEKIFDETKKMIELAKLTHVDYDGWGTYFEE
jgi:regulator of RNase E activity RraB